MVACAQQIVSGMGIRRSCGFYSISPNSASCERVFSLLRVMYGEQQSCVLCVVGSLAALLALCLCEPPNKGQRISESKPWRAAWRRAKRRGERGGGQWREGEGGFAPPPPMECGEKQTPWPLFGPGPVCCVSKRVGGGWRLATGGREKGVTQGRGEYTLSKGGTGYSILESQSFISRGLLTARAGKGCSSLVTRVPPPTPPPRCFFLVSRPT